MPELGFDVHRTAHGLGIYSKTANSVARVYPASSAADRSSSESITPDTPVKPLASAPAELWAQAGLPLVLGHALSMTAIHGGKAKVVDTATGETPEGSFISRVSRKPRPLQPVVGEQSGGLVGGHRVVDADAGHGIGSTRAQRQDELADVWAFMLWQFEHSR